VRFEVVEPEVEELEEGPPERVAAENAVRKAETVAGRVSDAAVLGVDTVVSRDGRIYGKPADPDEARRTLGELSGRSHVVTSGVCLVEDGRSRSALSATAVTFRVVDEQLIDWYVGTEEWRGRAGGYAIQGRGAALVAAIEGDYLNVVGLPVVTVLELAPELLQKNPSASRNRR
jgi:septum formation protein